MNWIWNWAGGKSDSPHWFRRSKRARANPSRFALPPNPNIPFLGRVYAHAGSRHLDRSMRDEAIWRYELNGKSERNINRSVFRIIENTAGEPVGCVSHPWFNWEWGIPLFEYELKPGVSWLAVTPSVARYILSTSREYALRDGQSLENRTAVPF